MKNFFRLDLRFRDQKKDKNICLKTLVIFIEVRESCRAEKSICQKMNRRRPEMRKNTLLGNNQAFLPKSPNKRVEISAEQSIYYPVVIYLNNKT